MRTGRTARNDVTGRTGGAVSARSGSRTSGSARVSARNRNESFVGAHSRLGTRGASNSRSYGANAHGSPHYGNGRKGGRHGGGRYYRPYYHHHTKRYCGFYYPLRVTYTYVPYGFYGDGVSVYVDDSDSVNDHYAAERYEETTSLPEDDEREITHEAAAGSAAAERYMREATEFFEACSYPEAARRFRLAAIAAPNEAGPLFALGQSLIALQNYPYAAKVVRQSFELEPTILKEGGDIVGVYKDRAEFDRVTATIQQRINDRPDDMHAKFLLGVQQYFSGDPSARETLGALAVGNSSDRILNDLREACETRFEKADELPPIEAPADE
ncbi:MAG: tetratricopeptide repeat protein [Planctomycetota bacterium]